MPDLQPGPPSAPQDDALGPPEPAEAPPLAPQLHLQRRLDGPAVLPHLDSGRPRRAAVLGPEQVMDALAAGEGEAAPHPPAYPQAVQRNRALVPVVVGAPPERHEGPPVHPQLQRARRRAGERRPQVRRPLRRPALPRAGHAPDAERALHPAAPGKRGVERGIQRAAPSVHPAAERAAADPLEVREVVVDGGAGVLLQEVEDRAAPSVHREVHRGTLGGELRPAAARRGRVAGKEGETVRPDDDRPVAGGGHQVGIPPEEPARRAEHPRVHSHFGIARVDQPPSSRGRPLPG